MMLYTPQDRIVTLGAGMQVRAQVVGGAFNYTDIPGCVALLKMYSTAQLYKDSARTDPVTANADVVGGVADLSGTSNHLSQATTGYRGQYLTNIFNGLGVVRFDATDDYMTFANAITMTPSTVFLAFAKRSASGSAAGILTTSGGSGYVSFGDSGGNGAWNLWESASNVINISGTHTGTATDVCKIHALRAAVSNNADVRVNGTQIGTDTNYSGLTQTYTRLGQWANLSFGAKDILMVVAYNSRLSDGDCGLVEAAMSAELGGVY